MSTANGGQQKTASKKGLETFSDRPKTTFKRFL